MLQPRPKSRSISRSRSTSYQKQRNSVGNQQQKGVVNTAGAPIAKQDFPLLNRRGSYSNNQNKQAIRGNIATGAGYQFDNDGRQSVSINIKKNYLTEISKSQTGRHRSSRSDSANSNTKPAIASSSKKASNKKLTNNHNSAAKRSSADDISQKIPDKE